MDATFVSESFRNQSVWMRNEIIRTERVMAWKTGNGTVSFGMNLRYIKRIQTEWEFCSDRCAIIRIELETSIQTEKEWIVIGRSHSDFHYEWVRAFGNRFRIHSFIIDRNESEMYGLKRNRFHSETRIRESIESMIALTYRLKNHASFLLYLPIENFPSQCLQAEAIW